MCVVIEMEEERDSLKSKSHWLAGVSAPHPTPLIPPLTPPL